MSTATDLDRIRHEIDEQLVRFQVSRGRLQDAWSPFSQVIQQHPLEKIDLSSRIDRELNALAGALHNLNENAVSLVREKLSARLREIASMLDHDGHQLTEDQGKVQQDVAGFMDNLGKSGQQIVADSQQLSQVQQRLQNDLQNMAQRLAHEAQQLNSQLQAQQNEIQQHWQPAFQQDLTQFGQSIQQAGTQTVATAISQGQSQMQQDQHQFMTGLQQEGSTLNHNMDQWLSSLGTHIGQTVQSQLQQEGHKLVDSVLLALLNEAQHAVVDTTLGTQITAALSPILPGMISVYKATEVIKEAIHMFKEMEKVFKPFG